jgi:hypothetical protein
VRPDTRAHNDMLYCACILLNNICHNPESPEHPAPYSYHEHFAVHNELPP